MAKPQIDRQVITRLRAICAGETDHVTLMALAAGELCHAVDGFDRVGFCQVVVPGMLKLWPYKGGNSCLVIPFAKRVCGVAARKQQPQIVDDVHQFDGHIACAASTQSELFVPGFDKGQNLVVVLNADSNQLEFSARRSPGNSIRLWPNYLAGVRKCNDTK